jgi:hypothetical protein
MFLQLLLKLHARSYQLTRQSEIQQVSKTKQLPLEDLMELPQPVAEVVE